MISRLTDAMTASSIRFGNAAEAGALTALAFGAVFVIGACAQPPGVEGAACPCPADYSCDPVRKVCVPGVIPPIGNPTPPLARACRTVGTVPPRALTPTEYQHTVGDLLGVTVQPSELPPEAFGQSGFSNAADRIGDVDRLRPLARVVAERARPALPSRFPCDLRPDECVTRFIQRFGSQAFRGPLQPQEQALLLDAYKLGAAGGDHWAGIARVVETALGADAFLIRRERGLPPGSDDPLIALPGHELASRLSFLLWASAPDERLLEAASKGELGTRASLLAEVDRMLADPRADRGLRTFHRQWLEVDPAVVARDSESLGFTDELRASVLRSSDELVRNLVLADDAELGTLLTYPAVFADARMASFFGLAAPATEFAPVLPMGGQSRHGLLTVPSRLATFNQGEVPNPVLRGVWVNERLLCSNLPNPTVNIPPPPPADPGSTNRQRYEQHRQDPVCLACHMYIDPLGFALDNYDGLGRWRTREGQFEVDASGSTGGMSWSGPAQLAQQLASSPQVRECVVRQWFRYSFGRQETEADTCTMEALKEGFAQGGYRTKALLRAIAISDAFGTLSVRQ